MAPSFFVRFELFVKQLGDRGERGSSKESSAPKVADHDGEIVAIGSYITPLGVTSRRACAGDMLFAAHLGNLHDGASLTPSLHAGERHRLPCPEGKECGQKPGCRMLLH
jgi:hypothetical protein